MDTMRPRDRQEIQDCLFRYVRGVDRRNWDLARSAYLRTPSTITATARVASMVSSTRLCGVTQRSSDRCIWLETS